MVGLYITFGDWANALECWRSPSLRLVIPGIAVSPGVTHSDSRIVFVTGTVVKPQQPTNFNVMVGGWMVGAGWLGLYISFGDWANALECWRSPSLRLVIPGIAVSPGVTHSDSRIVFVTGTVVKHQPTNQPTNFNFNLRERERSDLGLCTRDWSTRYCTNRRERPSPLDLLSEFGLISDGWLGSISPLEIEPMHLSVEGLRPWDWSYPVLQYLREWPTPTVVSSLSRVLS